MRTAWLLSLALVPACATGPRAEDVRRSLLAAHARERAAHLARDADALAGVTAAEFTSVDRGEVRTPSPAEFRARFARYFAEVTFVRWDDLEPPRVWISSDGTLASVAVRKEVVARAVADGALDRTVFAWLETWERRADGWRLVALASTRAQPDASTP